MTLKGKYSKPKLIIHLVASNNELYEDVRYRQEEQICIFFHL